eukprot:c11233_g1_i1.p2 GENE.c11233_g1_i1~~c11233_g1_i1.p2  ORF type:complete len:612 (+),score=168.64 c11233_g1_i1:1-1836(+)
MGFLRTADQLAVLAHKDMSYANSKHGGLVFAQCLKNHNVTHVFTLTGGHIAPILLGCDKLGIKVVDVRDEVTAVFAADAVARLTGGVGVAIVTAGPGLTNTITALKNASMAQSPIVLFAGAAATLLRGRGALQDIDQLELVRPLVKWATSVSKTEDIAGVVQKAFAEAASGVAGPVFIETPLDVLWPREVVEKEMLSGSSVKSSVFSIGGITERVLNLYVQHHVSRMFAGLDGTVNCIPLAPRVQMPSPSLVVQAARALQGAARPVIIVGSQAVSITSQISDIVGSLTSLGVPTFLAGMARGLLGRNHPLQMRHHRAYALKHADFVLLAGIPQDFRLGYGRQIASRAYIVSVNRSKADLQLNRAPSLGVQGDPGRFLVELGKQLPAASGARWSKWTKTNKDLNDTRDAEIKEKSEEPSDKFCNPLAVATMLEDMMGENAIIVADGGDFIATASYVLRPRTPLSWLDPGPFGTLGVGGGFAMGAALMRPDAEVWLLYGDGSSAYSLAEFDTYRRHRIPVIAVIGNDAAWMQMYRGQVEFFANDVATSLRYTDYHEVARHYGGADYVLGVVVKQISELRPALAAAKQAVKEGRCALINVLIGKSSFRQGSISV